MSAVGIICEYNPFHNGHKYQLEMCRKGQGKDTVVICVMSGDFVQRGEAAMYSKFARAEAACRSGADLVVELPLEWAMAPAEKFAYGAVSMLSALGVDELCFGSECGDVEVMTRAVDAIMDSRTDKIIKNIMKEKPELPYAAAREKAVELVEGEKVSAVLRKPNNILGIEYIKASRLLGSNMKISTVTRVGSGHDQKGDTDFRSASELRDMISAGQDIIGLVPETAREIYIKERQQGRELSDKSYFETAVLSRLRMMEEDAFLELPDAEEGLCRRIYKAVRTEPELSAVYDAAKTKRYSHARIRRLCISAALGLKKNDGKDAPPYARILAANEYGRSYLREIKDICCLPVITKPADVRQYSQKIQDVFATGASAHDLYVLSYAKKCPTSCGEDWRRGPVIV